MQEIYDSRLVAGKLRRWSHYLQHYRLPTWEQIPTLGLYMDQVLTLLSRYLPFCPKGEGGADHHHQRHQQLCPHEADARAGEEKV